MKLLMTICLVLIIYLILSNDSGNGGMKSGKKNFHA